jgi:hypothetical protein
MGEAKLGEPGSGVRLVPKAVTRLLRRRSVVAQAVGLDNEAQLGPEEVHPEAVHSLLGQRSRQAGSPRDRDEAPLEL